MKFADENDRIRYLKQILFQKKSALPKNVKIVKHPKIGGVYYAVDSATGVAYMVFEDLEAVEDAPIHTVPGFEHLKK